jgi:REP element-mobilizing transposase RayT
MPQSLSAVYLHAVFSTKQHRTFLLDVAVRTEMHAYLGGLSKQLDCPPLIIGGVDDHVHLLVRFGRTITQADWIKELKRVSSVWIKGRAPDDCGDFAWQAGYGVFSVSGSRLDAVHEYIATQESHHRKATFEDEFRGLLRKHGMEWDERYVWD